MSKERLQEAAEAYLFTKGIEAVMDLDSWHEIPELMADFAAEQIAELEERFNTAMGLLSEIQFDHSDRNSEDYITFYYNECDGNSCEFCKQVRSLADKEY